MASGTVDKTEHHAGLILYRISPRTGVAEVLLFNDSFSPKRHWTPAKGKVVGSETDLNCARRQVGELTGLSSKDYRVEDDFRIEIKYLADTRPKRVVYLLAEASDHARIAPAGEGIHFAWLPLQSAIDKSMFRSMHDVLKKAFDYIETLRKARGPLSRDVHTTGGSHHFRTPQELDQRFMRCLNFNISDRRFRLQPNGTHGLSQRQLFERSGDEEPGSPVPRGDDNGRPNSVMENALYKTRLCERFMNEGSCFYSSKCSFAHGAHELRERPWHHGHHGGPSQAGTGGENKLFKTKLCEKFARDGSCSFGSACNFAHGEVELRERPPPSFGKHHPRDSDDGDLSAGTPPMPRSGGEVKSRPQDEEHRPKSPGSSALKYAAAYGLKARMSEESASSTTSSAAGSVESLLVSRRSTGRSAITDLGNSDGSIEHQTLPGCARGDGSKARSRTKGSTDVTASLVHSNSRGDLAKSVSLKQLLSQEKAEQDRAWVKVVELPGDNEKAIKPPEVQQRQLPSKEEQLATDLKKFMVDSLAAIGALGPSPERQKLLAAEIKEVTRIEFRNNLSKPQLFSVLLPSLCTAPETLVKDLRLRLQLMKTFVRSMADQMAWVNAWERWLAKNPPFLLRATVLFKFFYDVELVEEDVYLSWHTGPVAVGGSTKVREKLRPFVEWLQNAEEED